MDQSRLGIMWIDINQHRNSQPPALAIDIVFLKRKASLYYGFLLDVKLTIKDCQSRGHLLFDAKLSDSNLILKD